jgi:hypothetical protein
MPELELELNCDNCGAKCRIIYEDHQVDPETCPFCGEFFGNELDDDDDDWLDDDGLGNEDDADNSWN